MTVLLRLVLISLSWIVIEIGAGFLVHRFPRAWFERDGSLTRVRRWEAGGRVYQRLFRIRRWKDSLPEAGNWFAGGMRKSLDSGSNGDQLRRLAAETRRAELTHWLPVPLSLTFFLWNPLPIAIWMPLVALLGNAPFIAVQRYNRPRIVRAMSRRIGDGDRCDEMT